MRSMSRPRRDHRLGVLAVRDAHDVLLDDRAGVELLGHVVRGRADDLHAALERALVGLAPAKAGRNEWWMLITGTPSALEEVAGEDLHVAGEHDEVDVAAAARAARASASGLPPRSTGTWWYGTPKPSTSARWSGWFETTSTIVGVELAAALAPQQVEQAVVLARDEHRHALGRAGVGRAASACRAARRPPARTRVAERRPRSPRSSVNSIRMKNRRPRGRSSAGRR